MNPTVEALSAAVRGMGARFDENVLLATRDLYREHLPVGPAPDARDVRYGSHERHRLDVYRPASRALGVVVFVHGGGFVAGDKAIDEVYYGNVGRFFAAEGYAAVLVNYRLAPQAGWPAGAEDVQAALAWLMAEARSLGLEGLPVFVLGQSAGASHVASWLFDDSARGGHLPSVAGVLLMSGFYQARAPLPATAAAYFGTEAANWEPRSPLSHVRDPGVPLWLSVAQWDPASIASHTLRLADALAGHLGRLPAFECFAAHNHVSTILSLGSPQRDVAESILAFLRDATLPAPR